MLHFIKKLNAQSTIIKLLILEISAINKASANIRLTISWLDVPIFSFPDAYLYKKNIQLELAFVMQPSPDKSL